MNLDTTNRDASGGGQGRHPASQFIVLGVHRSGTSLLTETAVRLGLFAGEPEEIDGADQWNANGYWEHVGVRALDEELLFAVETDWFGGLQFAPERIPEEKRGAFAARAAAIVAKLDAHAPWVVKDPRMCVLLSFWRPLLSRPAFLVSLRHPLAVARSLRTRDRFPIPFGLALWEAQILSALAHSRSAPRAAFWYEDLVERPEEETARLASWLRETSGGLAGGLAATPAASAGLRHHRIDPAEELALPAGTRRVLDALRDGSAFDDAFDTTPSDDARALVSFYDEKERVRRFLETGWRAQQAAHHEAIAHYEALLGAHGRGAQRDRSSSPIRSLLAGAIGLGSAAAASPVNRPAPQQHGTRGSDDERSRPPKPSTERATAGTPAADGTIATPRAGAGQGESMSRAIPLPPIEMRQLVGPTADEFFDNPTGRLVLPGIAPERYASVFDFGCGCGRLARQLIQQTPRPERYVGVDLHKGMVRWCKSNLEPVAPGFQFHHHDVHNLGFNPDATSRTLPLPAPSSSFTLVIAWSVFTHLLEEQVMHYLREVKRILAPDGVFVSTWFTFDKVAYPMMQSFQNALYINSTDPTNAVIFDRAWLQRCFSDAGLAPTRIVAPEVRGYQWLIEMRHAVEGNVAVDFPPDVANTGIVRPPVPETPASCIGIEPK